MSETLGMSCRRFLVNNRILKVAWLLMVGILALYLGAIRPHENLFDMSNQKGADFASIDRAEPHAFYSRFIPQKGTMGGVPGRHSNNFVVTASLGSVAGPDADKNPSGDESDRKMVRTSTLELIVQHPAGAAEKISALAEQWRIPGQLGSSGRPRCDGR